VDDGVYYGSGKGLRTSKYILAGFQKAGLSPFSPISVLSTLEMFDVTPNAIRTPTTPNRDKSALKTMLLASSPPNGTDI